MEEPSAPEIPVERSPGISALIPLLADLGPEVRAALDDACAVGWCAAGEALLGQGEQPTRWVLILSGRVSVSHRNPVSGLHFEDGELGAGADLTLAEAVAGAPCPLSARAVVDVKSASLSGAALDALCAQHPSLASLIRRTLAARLVGSRSDPRVVDVGRLRIDNGLLSLVPRHLIQKYKALPLARNGATVVVGFVDESDLGAIDDIRRLLVGFNVQTLAIELASFERFVRTRVNPALERAVPETGTADRLLKAVQKKVFETRILETAPVVDDKSKLVPGEQVVILLNRLIGEAIELSASDIHIEPTETECVVRYRVDGLLCRRPGFLDPRFHGALTSRLKALAHMDIADRRRAQDGRLSIQHGNNIAELRLSTMPTRFGEKVVIRILDPGSLLVDLERLVTYEPAFKSLRAMIDQPQGIVIVAGPTGSGKTTTIYSAMRRLKREAINIVTIEDPIEYTIEGLTQVQVNEAAGVSFANSVRNFLRQDPDVILVGETRDRETAATSIEASLTGHLVLTSLHANDAFGAVVRLRDMGIERFLLAHSLVGVISQRLVRRVCVHCRELASWHPELIHPLGLFTPEEEARGLRFSRGKGCFHCNEQGFHGRVGVFEVLRVSDTLRPALASGRPIDEIERIARREGLFHPIQEYCRHLLLGGITTPEEIARILFSES